MAVGDAAPAAIADAHTRPLTDHEREYVGAELAAAAAQVTVLRGRDVPLDPVMLRSLTEARRGYELGPAGRELAATDGWWRPAPPSFPHPAQAGTRTSPLSVRRPGRTGPRPAPGRDLDR